MEQNNSWQMRKILRDATDGLGQTCCKTDMRDNLTFIRQVEAIQRERQDYLHLVTARCPEHKQRGVKGNDSQVPDCYKFHNHKPQRSQLSRILVDDTHKVLIYPSTRF